MQAIDPSGMRALVIGNSCAGKSTFARALAANTSLPLIELDALYWEPHWQPKERSTFRREVARAIAGNCWIVVGNYSSVRDVVWPRPTMVFWLNYGFPIVFARALRRTIRRSVTGEELWNGNRESWRRSFLSSDSILWWVITTHQRRRREFAALRAANAYPALSWVEFRRPADAASFLR